MVTRRIFLSPVLIVGVLSFSGVLFVARASAAETTVLASVDSAGTQGNNDSFQAKISSNGRFVAFASDASNLVPGELNNAEDIFHHDLVSGRTIRVSVDSNGGEANGTSFHHAISGNGRSVAFTSNATNLVPGDTNGTIDVFVHDVLKGTTTRVSVDANGLQANAASRNPSISHTGRFVAFESLAPLVSEDTNGVSDIYVRDLVLHTTTLVSVGAGGLANGPSILPSISANGRFVAFMSEATNLVPGDTNGKIDVFVHDRLKGSTVRVSVDSNGLEGNDHSGFPSISADGNIVAFISGATNLVPGDTNGALDVFVRDISAGTTTRVSQGLNGAEANGPSLEPSISPDGGFVAFRSQADNLVQGDTNGMSDVFVYDLTQNTTVRVSVSAGGIEGNGGSFIPSISSGGGSVAFESFATNLVGGDTNGHEDVFVRVRH